MPSGTARASLLSGDPVQGEWPAVKDLAAAQRRALQDCDKQKYANCKCFG